MEQKIVVKYNHIEINDYHKGDCTRLENQFRLYDPITHSYYYLGMHLDEETNTLYLPRSIDIFFVEQCFRTKSYMERNCTLFEPTGEIKLKNLPRDEVQKEALRFMVGSGEYLENKNRSQIGLNLSTGKGKTYSSIACISFYELRSIIITTSIDWLNQWKESFSKFSTITERDICMISGTGVAMRLMKTCGEKYKIFLVSHATLNSIGTNHGWKTVGKLFEALRIGCVFYDEAHKNFLNISMIDFYTNSYKTYYITATPARSSEGENRVYSLYFKNMPSIELFDEEVDPHTHYIAFKFNSEPTPYDISSCKNQYGLNRIAYTEYVVNQPNFYKLLRILMNKVLKIDGKALFYIGTNNALLKVYEWLYFNYPELYGNIGIYTSIMDNDAKAQQLQKKLILSTTKSFGEAVDCKGLTLTVVLAEPFKSEVLARQTLGRTRDNDTEYIDVVDIGFQQCRKYNYSKRDIFKKYAKTVTDINISLQDLDRLSDAITKNRASNSKPLITFDKDME